MHIKVFKQGRIPQDLYLKTRYFLLHYIAEGTVGMDPSVYDKANYTAILIDGNEVKGFSALQEFHYKNMTIIQIMATFFSEEARGFKLASMLMQGKAFLASFLRHPWRRIYWCTRTRVPSAYAAARRYHRVLPDFKSVEKNRLNAPLASKIAKIIYSDNLEFNQDSYVMKNSYTNVEYYCKPKNESKESTLTRWISQKINYEKNEAIFIFAKMRYLILLGYVVLSFYSKCKYYLQLKKLSFSKQKIVNSKL